MKITRTQIKNRFLNALGAESLGSLFLTFALVHLIFNLYSNLQGQYISTLFMRATQGDANIVKYYNMINFGMSGFAMCMASVFVRKFSVTAGTRIGLLFYMAGTGMFLLFMHNLAPVMPLIAVINALGGGAYWIAYCIAISEYSNDENRDRALGFISAICGVVTLVIPLFSGLILTAFGGENIGYYIVFGLSFTTALVTLWMTRKLEVLHTPAKQTHFGQALSSVVRDKLWRFALTGEFLKGIREGTFSFFLNLLLFSLVSNEAVIGVNTVLASLASILAASLIGKWVRPSNRIKSMLVSVTAMIVGIAMLYVNLSPVTIILFNLMNSFVTLFLLNPAGSIFFMVIQKAPGAREMQSEFFGIREVCLNMGRITGIIVTMVMPQSSFGNVTAMCILTLVQYLMVLCYSRVVKRIEKEVRQPHEELSSQ